MSLGFWIVLWKIVLIGGIGLFAVLAVVVTVGGLSDVRRLFQSLRQTEAEEKSGEQGNSIQKKR